MNSLPLSPAEAAKELLRRRAIRASLESWCTEALAPLGHKPAAHHKLLIRELEALARGDNDRLMVFMPPGSAKSTYASVLFPAWFLAQAPNQTIIGASNTADLAQLFSRRVQGLVRDFSPSLGYGLDRESAELWTTTNGGQYRSAGVGGTITGYRADLAIIDDPVKSRAVADSEVEREKTWNWFGADLRTRLKPEAKIAIIQTRWHEDDLSGRLLATQAGRWRVVCLPATAREDDPLGRAAGELLWSDDPTYPYGAELAKVKADAEANGAMRDWWALYEQDPRPLDGGLFNVTQLGTLDAAPAGGRVVRAWDLAATEQTGTRDPDWTVGVKMQRVDDRLVVQDVVRLRGAPEEVERAILNTAQADGRNVRIGLPQDPGQAGKAQVLYFTRKLAGFIVDSSTETGDKATRAMPFASQMNVGNVAVVRGSWNTAYREELRGFPSATKDDQVDASSRAFAMLVAQPGPPRITKPLGF